MATFTFVPSKGVKASVDFKILKADFGDGYSQRAQDGLNSQQEKWNLAFTDFPDATIDAIVAFIDAQEGHIAFDWTPPKQVVSKQFICTEYTRTESEFATGTLTAVFERVFDL